MEITQDLVRQRFIYKDGVLYNNYSTKRVKKGAISGCIHKNGYRRIVIDFKLYSAHRLIFLFHNGYLPKYVDHIDRDPSNNRVENLRPCTVRENSCNHDARPGCTSKYLGVCWCKKSKKWMATMGVNRRSIYLGRFESEIDAALIYNEYATIYHGEFANLNIIENE